MNCDLKGMIFTALANHEQEELMSSQQTETRLLLHIYEQFIELISAPL